MFCPPKNLVAIEDYGWLRRPGQVKLDLEEVRTALWVAGGIVGRAAEILKVDRTRLRRFIGMSEYLHGEWCEIWEQQLDKAESVVHEAVHDPELKRAFPMSQFVLSKFGTERGWGTNRNTAGSSATPNRNLLVTWANEPAPSDAE